LEGLLVAGELGMDDKIRYWLDIAEYDLTTAVAMLDTGRRLYVGFMCHQAIEKTIKAHYQLVKGALPPRTHNLLFLLRETALLDSLADRQRAFMEMLLPMNIEARYPEYKARMFESLDRDTCGEILRETKEMHAWIKEKLSKRQEVTQEPPGIS
jgi:HEPN domain-containing protein